MASCASIPPAGTSGDSRCPGREQTSASCWAATARCGARSPAPTGSLWRDRGRLSSCRSYFFAPPARPAERRGVALRLELALRAVVARLPRAACCTSSRSLAIRRLVRPRFLRASRSVLSRSLSRSREPRDISERRSLSAVCAASIESFRRPSASGLPPAPPCWRVAGRRVCVFRSATTQPPLDQLYPDSEPTPCLRRLLVEHALHRRQPRGVGGVACFLTESARSGAFHARQVEQVRRPAARTDR